VTGGEAAALPPLREVAAVTVVVKGEAEVGVEPQRPLVVATVMAAVREAAVKEAAVKEAAVSWVVAAVALLPLPLVGAEAAEASVATVATVAVHLPRHLLAVAVIKEEGVSSVVAVKEAAPQLLRLRADPAAAVTVVVKGEAASGALLRLLQHSLRVAAAMVAVMVAAVAL
jgi:hypothetical protein